MKQAPSKWDIAQLTDHIKTGPQAGIQVGGMTIWVPARPLGFNSIPSRLRLAWMVFKGQADALVWPGQ